jgi:hypothetical protein
MAPLFRRFIRGGAGLAMLLGITAALFPACSMMTGEDWVEDKTGSASQLSVYFDSDLPGGGFERWSCMVGETILLPNGAKLFQVDHQFLGWKLVGASGENGGYSAHSFYQVDQNVVFTSVWAD